ncbi:hypothetical protein [Streptomyces sp. NPDC059928]|uniref:hypothetical protein n=1 Tax=unclassified Streptomyces TaxID=2593676 RepID=UPI00364FE745
MTSLFERLDAEEAIVRGELAALREKIAVAEERLAHLTITRETLQSLMGDAPTVDTPRGPQAQAHVGDVSGQGRTDAASADQGSGDPGEGPAPGGPLPLEVARERMLVLLAGAGRAMKVQDISAAIGEDTSNQRLVETTRSRLKRLAKEGRVVEGPIAWFSIAPTDNASRQQGDATG